MMNASDSADLPPSSYVALTRMPAAALDAIPAAIAVLDREGRILRLNRRGAELSGWSLGAVIEDRRDISDVLATGRPARSCEIEFARADGTCSVALMDLEALYDAAGQIRGVAASLRDITCRRALESELRQSRAFLDAVVETTPECIKVVAADGRLLKMNRAGLAMIGSNAFAAVEGASIYTLIAPEDRRNWEDMHARVIAGERLNWEFDIVGLNGTRRRMETHAVPLPMPDGSVAQLAATRDVSQRRRDEMALLESARRYRDTLEALPAAIYTTDAEGRVTYYNEAAVTLSGHRPVIGSASWCVTHKLFWPDGSFLPHDQCPMAIGLREKRAIHGEYQAVAERPDGTRVPFIPYVTPLFDDEGRLLGAVNMLVDITERKRAEELQKMLLDELNHRVKNTLSIVHSLAAQTAKGAGSITDFTRGFNDRLVALSRTHDLLARGGWEEAPLDDLVRQVLQPYGVSAPAGLPVALKPACALSLAMVLHELATNAAKYGALSAPDGRVSLEWRRGGVEGHERLQLIWQESGGPPVREPSSRGFGSRLIERAVTRDLEGEAELVFQPEGLRCRIEIPLGRAPASLH